MHVKPDCKSFPRLLYSLVIIFSGCLQTVELLASGPGDDPASWQTGRLIRQTLVHDEIEREYFVYLPTRFSQTPDLPIVLVLHGYGGSATGVALETSGGFNHYAEALGYIVVYPQGTHFLSAGKDGKNNFTSSWNDLGGSQSDGPLGPLCTADSIKYPCPPECGECGQCHWTSCHDDIGFIAALMQKLQSTFNSDASRQFLTGFSNGSMMTQRLACEIGEYWSAVAMVSGRLSLGYSCSPEHPMPLLQLDGVKDPVMPYDDSASSAGYFYTGANEVTRQWAKSAGCEYDPQPYVPGLGKKDNVQCEIHRECGEAAIEIVSCALPEGDHTWPGYPVHGGWCAAEEQQGTVAMPLCKEPGVGRDIWGSRMILQFFDKHGKH